jgi:hypothetical protein
VLNLLALIGGPHSVWYRAPLPDDGEGERWADPVEVTGCRVERETKQHQALDGRVVTLTALVIAPAAPVIEVGGRMSLDGDDGPWRRVEVSGGPVWIDGELMHQEVRTT